MGESSLLLAEASVGKNAERDSHELGAREPSISTAAACVGCRSVDSPHTVLRAPQYSNDSPVITQRKATGGTVRHLFYVWLNVNFWKHLQSVSTCFFLFFLFSFASKEDLLLYAFTPVSTMPADTMEKQTASPIAGAPANGSHTPDKPKNASEHRKVRIFYFHKQMFCVLM